MSPPTSHRRHPSAPPAVIVQPTKVPGILSVSKPLRTSSPRQHQQQPHNNIRPNRSPKSKHTAPQNRPHLPQLAEAQPTQGSSSSVQPKQASDVAATALEKKPPAQPATPLPDKSARGRQNKQPKDKGMTSTSSHAHARRSNIRQPSPPIHSSQAEVTHLSSTQSFAHRNNHPASNSFDPFVVSSDSDSDNSRPPTMSLPSKNGPSKAPPLAAQPSGKLARRRNHTVQHPATPTPLSRAVPVPRASTPRYHLSRSAPSNSGLASRSKDGNTQAGLRAEFPICDDTTDVEDNSFPTTPTRELSERSTWHQLTLSGPRTAPLSSSNSFTFAAPAGASPSPARRHHQRTPSEGVFNMSFDEDVASTSDASEELKKLFGFPPKRFGSVGASVTRTGKDKSGFFASSVFQNSPSPDELPPPAF
ncbi:hypothetical protein F5I97DRAFT_1806800 [Phlebopus sp. FC_14]|nr:hypothetical protein F5I97DRAFT_1806800 [Phlebopus sp. FC_14]